MQILNGIYFVFELFSKSKMNLFINSGMEVAAFLSDKAASVAVVGKSDVPYQFSLGPDIGKMTMQVRELLWFVSVHFFCERVHLLKSIFL